MGERCIRKIEFEVNKVTRNFKNFAIRMGSAANGYLVHHGEQAMCCMDIQNKVTLTSRARVSLFWVSAYRL